MGIQNSEHFEKVEDVELFYQLGQRCSQLTYNAQNLIGSGSTERVDGGVTDYGAGIIKAMNDVGMLIDVSHCGDRTTLDAIELSPRPDRKGGGVGKSVAVRVDLGGRREIK